VTACKGYDFRSGHPCAAEATQPVMAGCEHEHIGERHMCDRHVQHVRDGWMYCGDCAEVDGYRCRLYAIERGRLTAASHLHGGAT